MGEWWHRACRKWNTKWRPRKQWKQKLWQREYRLLPFMPAGILRAIGKVTGLLMRDRDLRHFLQNHKGPDELSKLCKLETPSG